MQFFLAKLISKSERRITRAVKNNKNFFLDYIYLHLFDSPHIIGYKSTQILGNFKSCTIM